MKVTTTILSIYIVYKAKLRLLKATIKAKYIAKLYKLAFSQLVSKSSIVRLSTLLLLRSKRYSKVALSKVKSLSTLEPTIAKFSSIVESRLIATDSTIQEYSDSSFIEDLDTINKAIIVSTRVGERVIKKKDIPEEYEYIEFN